MQKLIDNFKQTFENLIKKGKGTTGLPLSFPFGFIFDLSLTPRPSISAGSVALWS